jgi:hypothetical protein
MSDREENVRHAAGAERDELIDTLAALADELGADRIVRATSARLPTGRPHRTTAAS